MSVRNGEMEIKSKDGKKTITLEVPSSLSTAADAFGKKASKFKMKGSFNIRM